MIRKQSLSVDLFRNIMQKCFEKIPEIEMNSINESEIVVTIISCYILSMDYNEINLRDTH